MYLLQATADETFLMALLALFIGLLITYYIIKGAVKSANKGLHDELKLQNALKYKELQKQGHNEEELKQLASQIIKS